MLTCVDVHYGPAGAVAACLVFADWGDAEPVREYRTNLSSVEPYVPGAFYRRELPCLVKVLALVREPVTSIVVDGYVWLAGEGRPGLGGHLFEAMGQTVPVIGVAKSRLRGAGAAVLVMRGRSRTPLFVSAAGMDPEEAAAHIGGMHGAFRIPTLLKQVDQLSRREG